MEYQIRALQKSDNRKEFESGQADLDYFFWCYAGQNQFRHHIGVSYIATDEDTIFGYMTLAVGNLEIAKLPESKNLPRHHPLPILRIGRLAVDFRYQGEGIGKQLLRYALLSAIKQRDTAGCVGVVVDAKTQAIEYYRSLGFQLIDEPIEGEIRGNPPPQPMFIPIKSIVSKEKS